MAERTTETRIDPKTGLPTNSSTGPDTEKLKDLADASDRARLGSVAGKGLGSRGTKDTTGMPKMEPGEDSASYGERVRKWRAEKATGQKQALQSETK